MAASGSAVYEEEVRRVLLDSIQSALPSHDSPITADYPSPVVAH
jgi:hypothetical protein